MSSTAHQMSPWPRKWWHGWPRGCKGPLLLLHINPKNSRALCVVVNSSHIYRIPFDYVVFEGLGCLRLVFGVDGMWLQEDDSKWFVVISRHYAFDLWWPTLFTAYPYKWYLPTSGGNLKGGNMGQLSFREKSRRPLWLVWFIGRHICLPTWFAKRVVMTRQCR